MGSAELGAKYADPITHYKGKGTFINKETASVGAAVLPEGGLTSFNKRSFQKFISDQFNNLVRLERETLQCFVKGPVTTWNPDCQRVERLFPHAGSQAFLVS